MKDMKIIGAVIVSLVLITVVATGYVMMRPVWGTYQTKFDSVVTAFNVSAVSDNWTKTKNAVNNLWWLIPLFFVAVMIMYSWMTAQEKDYVTAGVYR